jgi:hypothetical protein
VPPPGAKGTTIRMGRSGKAAKAEVKPPPRKISAVSALAASFLTFAIDVQVRYRARQEADFKDSVLKETALKEIARKNRREG